MAIIYKILLIMVGYNVLTDAIHKPLKAGEIQEVSHHFTANLIRNLFNDGHLNIAMSPVRLLSVLSNIYSVGSPETKEYISKGLRLNEDAKQDICKEINKILNFDDSIDLHNYRVIFEEMFFYSTDIQVKNTIGNGCFRNKSQKIDFKDQKNAESKINEWFSKHSKLESIYLNGNLKDDENLMLMNALWVSQNYFEDFEDWGYKWFYDYYSRVNAQMFMRKSANFTYTRYSDKGKGIHLFFESHPGSRYGSLYMYPQYRSGSFKNFKDAFENFDTDLFSKLILTGVEPGKQENLTFCVPKIDLSFSSDLRQSFEKIGIEIFGSTDFMKDLLSESIFNTFPYSERITIKSRNMNGVTKPKSYTEVCGTTTLLGSFIYLLIDLETTVPIWTVVYTGDPNTALKD